MSKKKKDAKNIGRDEQQTQIIIQQEYNSELQLDDGSFYKNATFAFKGNPDAYAVIDKVCRTVAGLEYREYTLLDDGTKEYNDNSEFINLLKRPNEDRGQYEFMYERMLYLLLSGKSFQEKVMVNNTPQLLFNINPDKLNMKLSRSKQTGWVFDYNGNKTPYRMDEISYLKLTDPLDVFNGFAPIQSAGFEVDGNNQASKLNYSTLRNGGRPSGIFKTGKTFTDNEPALKRVKGMIKQMFSGTNNAGKTMLLENDVEFQQVSMTPKDMDFLKFIKLNAKKIAQVYGVPSILIGDVENSTYNNYRDAFRAFYNDTVFMYGKMMIDEWNNWIMPSYGANKYIEIDKRGISILQEDEDSKSTRILAQYNAGLISKNEGREKLGYEILEEDEEVIQEDTKSLESDMDILIKSILEKKNEITQVQANVALDTIDYKEFHNDTKEVYEEMIGTELSDSYTDLTGTGLTFEQAYGNSDAIRDYIEVESLEKSKYIVDNTLKSKLKVILDSGIVAGSSIDTIEEGIRNVFKEQYTNIDRANHLRTIARTETMATLNFSTEESYKQSGVVDGKEWITTIDDRTRGNNSKDKADHLHMDGQIVGLDDVFTDNRSGATASRPLAFSNASDVINCRCTMGSVIDTKSIYDTIEKKEDRWIKQNDIAEGWEISFTNTFQEGFDKQMNNIINYLNTI